MTLPTKLKLLAALAIGSSTGASAFAGTIDFENMPQDYWYFGGQVNFGNFWQGVTFGPQSTILEDQVFGYNSAGYPPHSGHAVLFTISLPYIEAVFDNPVDQVDLWYTSISDFVIDAYDSGGNLLTSSVGGANYGSNSPLGVSWATKDIKKIVMHDSGNYFTVDDITADLLTGNPRGVPDSLSTVSALAFAMGGLALLRRKYHP
ncbi:MAG TPA: hypothetical protein PLX89_19890 [Verrucomicrobiota bacterium]|nr:hypothetical protein [Verrucomicrobiota bacterium]